MKLSFPKLANVDTEKLIDIATDYDILPKLFPVEIIDKEVINNETIITEKISFYRFNFLQKSSHMKNDNSIITKILLGPLRNSVIKSYYETQNNATRITIDADLKLSLKYRLLGLFIKNRYEKALSQILNETISLAFLTKNRKWTDCLTEDRSGLIISWNDSKPITIYNWDPWTLAEIFYDEDYSKLPVRNKVVLDIGGFNGDSAIYFSLKGASKVICLEPFPRNFEIAYKNIHENGFADIVTILNAACSKNNGFVRLNSEYFGSDNSITSEQSGTKIPTMSLDKIVSEYNLVDGCLKIDCEGCEYDIILSCPKNTLKKFSSILLEFHDGSEKIVEKLSDCNFITDVKFLPNYKNNSRGYIFAERND